MRRGNLEVLDNLNYEFVSLRSQRQEKDFFSGLLMGSVKVLEKTMAILPQRTQRKAGLQIPAEKESDVM